MAATPHTTKVAQTEAIMRDWLHLRATTPNAWTTSVTTWVELKACCTRPTAERRITAVLAAFAHPGEPSSVAFGRWLAHYGGTTYAHNKPIDANNGLRSDADHWKEY